MLRKEEVEFLSKTRLFMFNDLRLAIGCGANFLIAAGLSIYTEAWGHLLVEPNTKSSDAYKAFFEYMGNNYRKLINSDEGKRIYNEVRCGLAHEYTIKKNAIIVMGVGQCGIEILQDGTIKFNIITYFHDFFRAIDRYISKVTKNKKMIETFRKARLGKPTIA